MEHETGARMTLTDDSIFNPEDALTFSMILNHASERMPGIPDSERAAVLEAARVLAAYACDAVIAGVVTERSMARASGRPAG